MPGLQLQTLLSGELSARNILVRPHEPPPEFLLSDPSDSIYIGKSELLHVPVFWDYRRLANPHIAIMGMTGSGKSYFIKAFLTRASAVWGSNALILDFAGEYVPWVRASGGKVVRLGAGHAINLLDTGGMNPEDRARQVMSSLEVLTDISHFPVQKRLTSDALDAAYARNLRKGKMPTFHDVEKELLRLPPARRKGDDFDGALHRIRQFLKKGREHFSSQSTLSLSGLASSGLVCLDLSSLPSEADRSLASLAILQYMREKMRLGGLKDEKKLKLIIVADEAWKIAQDDRSDLVAIIREGRKYSFGLIVSSQNPTDMSKSVLSNAGTVLSFRLSLPEFKSYAQQALNYDSVVAGKLEKFRVGQAAMQMAFEGRHYGFGAFVLDRVDGEALPIVFAILGVGKMDVKIDRAEFKKRLFMAGVSDTNSSRICALFEKNENCISAGDLAVELSCAGMPPQKMLFLLRDIGLADDAIAPALATLQARSLGLPREKIFDLVVEDG